MNDVELEVRCPVLPDFVRSISVELAEEPPLVVDLDGTLLATDTLDESLVAAFFNSPIAAVKALLALRDGIAPMKSALAKVAAVDLENMPVRQEVLAWLEHERARGRSIHLATAADRLIAERAAAQFPIFSSVEASDGRTNLKGAIKAQRLSERFPQGFSYIGDSRADLPVWRTARSALAIDKGGIREHLRASNIEPERMFPAQDGRWRSWMQAFRLHQCSKNLLVLAPALLAGSAVTLSGVATAVAAMFLLCILASLTYVLNDLADLSADRRHWSKRCRPFACGALPVRQGLLLTVLGVPVTLACAFVLAPGVGTALLAYFLLTLAYSIRFKRVPILDTFLIAGLFALRLVVGIVASDVVLSPWLLTFAMFFFFSLATAKRHAELLRAEERGINGRVGGRGYDVADKDATLIFGIGSGLASVMILVLFLTEEVFNRQLYATPDWMWIAPPVLFLWIARIWLLAHRGNMTDDPVQFALKDPLSLMSATAIGLAFLFSVI